MQIGDKVFYIENRTVKEAEVIKVTRDFVTLRYKSYVNYHESNGGLRLRASKVYKTKEEAEKHINQTKR